jgi:hypothetical protein
LLSALDVIILQRDPRFFVFPNTLIDSSNQQNCIL